MNKYIKMFMNDHDLEVDERFKIKGERHEYWFDSNGVLCCSDPRVCSHETVLLLRDILEVEKIKKGPWKPKLNELYWFISHYGEVYCNHNADDEQDKYIFTHRPIFPTEQEAADYKWFLDKVDKYKKPFELHEHNYYFYYDYESGSIYATYESSCQNQGTIYFGDEKNSDEFSEEVGEERIKKYWFNVWE